MHGGPGSGARECIAADRPAAEPCLLLWGLCGFFAVRTVHLSVLLTYFVFSGCCCAAWLVYCAFVSWCVLVTAYVGAQDGRLRLVVPRSLPAGRCPCLWRAFARAPAARHILCVTACACAARCVWGAWAGGRVCASCQLSGCCSCLKGCYHPQHQQRYSC